MAEKQEKETTNVKNTENTCNFQPYGDIDDFIFQQQEIKRHSER